MTQNNSDHEQERSSSTGLDDISLKQGLSRRTFLGFGAAAIAFGIPNPAQAAGGDGSGGGMGQGKGGGRKAATMMTAAIPGQKTSFDPTMFVPSCDGAVTFDLFAVEKDFHYSTPDREETVPTRTYNCDVPGPTFVVDPGDKLKLTLTNNLTATDASEIHRINWPESFSVTNLHFHGLHVSPSSYSIDGENVLSSDDVINPLKPGERREWCVVLPEFHAPGTHWYHAHKHGSTGVQVSNGMAGAIIIREPDQERAIVSPEQEQIMLIQEIIPPAPECATYTNADLPLYYQSPNLSEAEVQDLCKDLAVYARKGGSIANPYLQTETPGDFLVNGVYQPTLEITTGQTQRWRFINSTSTPRGNIALQLVKVGENLYDIPDYSNPDLQPMWLIAVDGISFYGKRPNLIGPSLDAPPPTAPCTENLKPLPTTPRSSMWSMASGNRADFLVNLPAGNYHLLKYDVKNTTPQAPIAIAFVQVSGADQQELLPGVVPGSLDDYPYLQPITDAQLVNQYGCARAIQFSRNVPKLCTEGQTPEADGCYEPEVVGQLIGPENFFVNKGGGKHQDRTGLYSPTCVDVHVGLNTCEEWALSTYSGAAHPFHIHVNPFQLVGDLIDPEEPNEPANWRWWDSIAVPQGDPLIIRNRFADYNGEYVFHCHILIHEDQGMMVNVYVDDSDSEEKGIPPCYTARKGPNGENVVAPTPEAQAVIDRGAIVKTPDGIGCEQEIIIPKVCPAPATSVTPSA